MFDDLKENLTGQARKVAVDAIDYLASVITLLQARLAQYAISTVLFTILIIFSSILMFAAFALLNVALGVWLAQALGSPLWSLLVLGGIYALMGIILGWSALRWLFRLRS